MSIKRIKKGPRMSQAVVRGNAVYLAGQVADDVSLDVPGQTREILAKIEGLLAEAGSDTSRILSANIWLADMARFADMNEVWDAWVDKENPPVRACVESKLATPDYLVEIMIVADC